jgi:uncharacterized membrane protein
MPSLFHRLLLLVALLTAVSACSRPAAPKPQMSMAMKRVLGPKGEVNAGGEIPAAWSAQVRPGRLNVSLTAGSDVSVLVADFAADDTSAHWTGKTAAGVVVALTVVRKPCADGATVMTYPLTAKAQVGGQAIAGCAAAPGQGLGPRT